MVEDVYKRQLMTIQVTVFPNSGFTICLTFNHVVGDGKSLHHFIKFWASLCKARGDLDPSETSMSLPSHERTRVKDPKGLKLFYSQAFAIMEPKITEFTGLRYRFTVVLSRKHTEKLKNWVSLKLSVYDSGALHISTFVVTCSLIWVSLVGSEESTQDSDKLCFLIFAADSRDCPEFSLTSTYFGNCVATCMVAMKRSEIVGENGIVAAAKAIEREIRDFKSDALRKFENLISDSRELEKLGKSALIIASSPKFGVYQSDFGWGKPKKCEVAHVESSAFMSLSECRDEKEGIEVGLALERTQMNKFNNNLEKELHNINKC
ncbi:shikimate O-hydroxycinnamoyltransferase [Vigna unguiculata]|uniref:Shikimate O-hydroxycinnamoyltransferase n=1 Tax=Vigna unguiculata TaxID=3917 RepID=A0A4D6N793_VIGUN|nr:shikimate O-hydroxycinnamoyltransferase [Vigna unguiculata]